MKNLSTQEIIQGITACFVNSNSLLEDSQLLFNDKRFSRSFALSQFAIEEVGKSLILFEMYFSILIGKKNEINFTEVKRHFKDHVFKSLKTVLMDFREYAYNSSEKSEFKTFFNQTIEEINDSKIKYDNLKNQSLYVSFQDNKFVKPNDIITEEMATTHIVKAKKRYKVCAEHISKFLKIISDANPNEEISLVEFNKSIK